MLTCKLLHTLRHMGQSLNRPNLCNPCMKRFVWFLAWFLQRTNSDFRIFTTMRGAFLYVLRSSDPYNFSNITLPPVLTLSTRLRGGLEWSLAQNQLQCNYSFSSLKLLELYNCAAAIHYKCKLLFYLHFAFFSRSDCPAYSLGPLFYAA